MNITSDYELKECEYIFNMMIQKYNTCAEAYFGMGKVYFSRNLMKQALDMFENAVNKQKKDPVYNLWISMTLYHIYRILDKMQKRSLYVF